MAVQMHWFHSSASLNELINYALFLHLGTFFAAVIYFRRDIMSALKAIFSPKESTLEGRQILIFLLITTVLTGLGQFIVNSANALAYSAPKAKLALTFLIAALLIVAGFLQMKTKTGGKRDATGVTFKDGLWLGVVQAFTTLPGLSRAGTTMAALAFRGFNQESALRLSFLMSLPVIFLGNIVRNYKMILTTGPHWAGVVSSFVVGILTIGLLMRFAKKVNFGVFLIFIGAILAAAAVTGMLD
jgi:undecaprenyl-diphosphatase